MLNRGLLVYYNKKQELQYSIENNLLFYWNLLINRKTKQNVCHSTSLILTMHTRGLTDAYIIEQKMTKLQALI